ncbi:hypothetical protein BpHYR1_014966 [Brachionus plicatilis]|uniref:Uncharacterized protein n=1 Tax=Brachionus plicatilis TaxID=10195 RepID=A0A3M7QT26_BRAPC|nr:hypothetical protein BpHYR1_014966 [Brachionus plicatilis]
MNLFIGTVVLLNGKIKLLNLVLKEKLCSIVSQILRSDFKQIFIFAENFIKYSNLKKTVKLNLKKNVSKKLNNYSNKIIILMSTDLGKKNIYAN